MPSSPSLQRYFSSAPSQYSSRLSSLSEMTNPVVVKKCLLKTLVQRIIESLISFHKRVEKINRFFLTTLWYSSLATLFCKSFHTFGSLFRYMYSQKGYILIKVRSILLSHFIDARLNINGSIFCTKNKYFKEKKFNERFGECLVFYIKRPISVESYMYKVTK